MNENENNKFIKINVNGKEIKMSLDMDKEEKNDYVLDDELDLSDTQDLTEIIEKVSEENHEC